MPLRTRTGTLVLLLLLGGCGTSLYRGDIVPPAQSRPATAPIYVQAREFAVEEKMYIFRYPGERMAGYTLDIHNRSAQPIVLSLSQAVRRAEQIDGPLRANAQSVASGAGPMPDYLPTGQHGPLDLTVPAGAKQTMWVLFEPLVYPPGDEVEEEFYRQMLVIPVRGGPGLTIMIRNPRESPDHFLRPARVGVSLVSTSRQYAESDLRLHSLFGPAVWYLRGPVKATVAYGFFELSEQPTPGEHDHVNWATLDVQWVPETWAMGAYLSGTVLGGDLARTPWATDGARFSTEVGLAIVVARFRGVPFSFRGGYSRVFNVPAARNGVILGLELPVIWF